jgi:hypothetical protein
VIVVLLRLPTVRRLFSRKTGLEAA